MRFRALLSLAACGLTAFAWLGPGRATAVGDEPRTAAGERAWSAQLHLHGSFSEGRGSIQSHLDEGSAVGIDVIWWSDHDFRIASYRHVSTFSFDGESEPLDAGEPWRALGGAERDRTKGLRNSERQRPGGGTAEFTTEHSRDGSPSLRLQRSGGGDERFRSLARLFVAERGLHHRPLASGVRVRLQVLPLDHDADGRAYVEFELSEHPRGADERLQRDVVHYYLSNEDTEPRRDGRLLEVPVSFEPGVWNELVLELTADTVAGFADIAGEDNGLGVLRVGVEARGRARPTAYFDDLRIEQDVSGAAALDEERALIERVGRRYPGVRQYQGVEISYWSMHLNEFSLHTPLPDYDRWLAESGLLRDPDGTLDEAAFAAYVADRAVREAHGRGGLVSYNHPFLISEIGGEASPEVDEAVEILAATRLYGADLLEVGYRNRGDRTLEEHVRLWDRLAERDLFPVGIGVSDSHGGPSARWADAPNNFVTWILAPTVEQADLLEGLRRGRAFFGDLVLFDGLLDLETARGFRMGQILITDRPAVSVRAIASGLGAGDRLVLVRGPGGSSEVHEVEGAAGGALSFEAALDTVPGFVRLELRDARDEAKALSNPIHVLREVPACGLAAARVAFDVGGLRSRGLGGFELTAVRAATVDGRLAVRIAGRGVGGTLELELPAGVASPEVRFTGLRGAARTAGARLSLDGLDGEGAVLVFLDD